MNTLRAKCLAAFLAGILCTLGVLTVREFAAMVVFRLDRIERFLSQQEMPQPQHQSYSYGSRKA
jgi:hypothetical protein